jgi:hypothetical protein
MRANRIAAVSAARPAGGALQRLRHAYASLCVAAELDYMAVFRFMGHSKPTTYTHLFNGGDQPTRWRH